MAATTARWHGELRLRALGLLVSALLVSCTSLGPRTVPGDRFNYSAAIARSRNEQMLLNIVRMRYLEVPDFLTVSSVIAGYTYEGGIGIVGQKAFDDFDEDFIGGAANLRYTERPTITYAPLAGQEFSRRMLKTIPIEVIFSLGQAGWPTDMLLRIAVQRIGDVENMAFGHIEGDEAFREEAEKLKTYDRVIRLLQRLQDRGAIEVVRVDDDPEREDEPPVFRFARVMPPALGALADEVKAYLGLEPGRNSFLVTDRLTHRDPSKELLIQTRSLLAIISFLSRGVNVPEVDTATKRAQPTPAFVQQVVQERGPLRILSREDRPDDPYAAIRYRDHWFYIDGGDLVSKRTFATLLVLFELLAPTGGGAAPLLSLPTG